MLYPLYFQTDNKYVLIQISPCNLQLLYKHSLIQILSFEEFVLNMCRTPKKRYISEEFQHSMKSLSFQISEHILNRTPSFQYALVLQVCLNFGDHIEICGRYYHSEVSHLSVDFFVVVLTFNQSICTHSLLMLSVIHSYPGS